MAMARRVSLYVLGKVETAHSLGGLETQFNVFLPEQALNGEKVP
jgi:hypothetical protein